MGQRFSAGPPVILVFTLFKQKISYVLTPRFFKPIQLENVADQSKMNEGYSNSGGFQ
jgi:hypothetical protein